MAPVTRSRGAAGAEGKGQKRARRGGGEGGKRGGGKPAKKTIGGEGKGKVRLERLNPPSNRDEERDEEGAEGKGQQRARVGGGAGGKRGGKPAKKTIGGEGNPPSNRDEERDEEEDGYDSTDGSNEYYNEPQPDRIVHMDKCSAMKKKLEAESKSRLEALNTFFEKKGIASYEEALRQLIEGNIKQRPATKAAIARKIAKYVEFRLINTNRILLELLDVEPWDQIYVAFLSDLMNRLKEDIVLSAPELDVIRAFIGVFLSATERSQVLMSPPMRKLVDTWLTNSMSENEMMRKWSECPSWLIDTRLHDRSVLPSDYFFGTGCY